MDQRQYIYDCHTHKARLYLQDGALFDLQAGTRLFLVEDDWAYGVATESPTFWINEKFLYLYRGGSNLAFEPSLYLGEIARTPAYTERRAYQAAVVMEPDDEPAAPKLGELTGYVHGIATSLRERSDVWKTSINQELSYFAEWASERAYSFLHRPKFRKARKRAPGSRIIWDDADLS